MSFYLFVAILVVVFLALFTSLEVLSVGLSNLELQLQCLGGFSASVVVIVEVFRFGFFEARYMLLRWFLASRSPAMVLSDIPASRRCWPRLISATTCQHQSSGSPPCCKSPELSFLRFFAMLLFLLLVTWVIVSLYEELLYLICVEIFILYSLFFFFCSDSNSTFTVLTICWWLSQV